jgi:cation:H+ antiporter
MALGNVVGSNIFNVLFILGLSALITPLVVDKQLIRQEVPIMIGVSLLLSCWRWTAAHRPASTAPCCSGLMVGLHDLPDRAVARARRSRCSEYTPKAGRPAAPAAGTPAAGADRCSSWAAWACWCSAPTLVGGHRVRALPGRQRRRDRPDHRRRRHLAARSGRLGHGRLRGERDIAVGNVVGSNTFNILGCLGLSSLAAGGTGLPVPPAVLGFDLWVMMATALACLPVFMTGREIARWEGAVFLAYYVAYVPT